jgi:histidyl-tRNA synthetase
MDHVGRGVKAQFKYADKADVSWVCILGDDELSRNEVKVRSMADGKEETISQFDLLEYFKSKKER